MNQPTYELWDLSTRNLIGAYTSESGARRAVQRMAARSRKAVASLALVRDTGTSTTTIARGNELLRRARRGAAVSA